MFEWYKKVVFENYANFEGRARRSEYWYYTLVNVIISLGLQILLGLINPTLAMAGFLYSLAVLLPSIGVAIRRMHDVGKSGWYILIPFYNLYLACMEGEKGNNEYGPDPKGGATSEINEIGRN